MSQRRDHLSGRASFILKSQDPGEVINCMASPGRRQSAAHCYAKLLTHGYKATQSTTQQMCRTLYTLHYTLFEEKKDYT